jgi:hypothetical protein
MLNASDVAQWMLAELEKSGCLYQEVAVNQIKAQFGGEFVYENDNGNPAISRKVLAEFRRLTEGKVIWDRYEKVWQKLQPGEEHEGRSNG